MSKILCVIPARGNSKRFPRKNIALLDGKPLIAYAIKEAKKSGVFDKIVVSTEDNEIADISEKHGAEVLKRSEELAIDTSTVREVTLDVIYKYEEKGEKFDIICILLSTSPLRKSKHIIEALEKFRNSDADYLMSTTDYQHSPFRALVKNKMGFLELFFEKKYCKRDQDVPKVVVHNGCIILMKTDKFKQDKTYYCDRLIDYHMPFEYSIDINEPVDLELAEFFLKKRKEKER